MAQRRRRGERFSPGRKAYVGRQKEHEPHRGDTFVERTFAMSSKTHEPTGFLNVDLDVYSRSNLEPLVAALGKKVLPLHVGREGQGHSAHLELCASREDADATIASLTTLIHKLPEQSESYGTERQPATSTSEYSQQPIARLAKFSFPVKRSRVFQRSEGESWSRSMALDSPTPRQRQNQEVTQTIKNPKRARRGGKVDASC
jgi:hypothetical protein